MVVVCDLFERYCINNSFFHAMIFFKKTAMFAVCYFSLIHPHQLVPLWNPPNETSKNALHFEL